MSVEIRHEHAHALRRAIEAEGVRIITPDDPARSLVLDVIALAQVAGHGWSRDHAARYVSVSLPALPQPLPALLTLGGVALRPFSALGSDALEALAALTARPLISLSPAALETPDGCVGTLLHEWQHVLQSDDGGVMHSIAYLARVDERCLACESPAYACDLAIDAWCRGMDPRVGAAQRAEVLRAYGADDATVRDAREILLSHAETLLVGLCPPVEALRRGVKVLRAAGVEGLPVLP